MAGKTLKRKGLNARKLAAAVAQVLANPTMVSSATALGGRMAGENGVATVIELIEKHLGDREHGLALPQPQRS